jgi:uncharacterized membrane protein
MYFIRNEIVDNLMEQYKIFYIKYYLFHDIMSIVKSIIFKLKTIKKKNIYIYIYIYIIFYNLNLKNIF